MSSHSGAYSRLVSPAPCSLVGEEQVPEAARPRLGLQVLHHRRMEVRVARLVDLLRVDGARRVDPSHELRERSRSSSARGREGEVHGPTLRAPPRAALPGPWVGPLSTRT